MLQAPVEMLACNERTVSKCAVPNRTELHCLVETWPVLSLVGSRHPTKQTEAPVEDICHKNV